MIGQAALSVVAGVPIGLQLGATGTGGAILAVPLLVYVAGISPKDAAAMSLVIVSASAWVGVWQYSRLGLVKPKAAMAFSMTGIAGSWVGAYGHTIVAGEILLAGFGIILLLARYLTWRQREFAREADTDSNCANRFPRTCWLKLAALGLLVGMLNGFFGVGGGFLIVPSLTLLAGFPTRQAVGTSLCTIAIISFGGIARHFQLGSLDTQLTMLVILGSAAGLLLGTRLSEMVSPKTIDRVTAMVTATIAVTLIVVNAAKILQD